MIRLLLLLLVGCVEPTPEAAEPPFVLVHPHLAAMPGDRAVVLERIDREPYATILVGLVAKADREVLIGAGPWSASEENANAEAAQANAFLAWLHQDEDRALRARDFLAAIRTDFDTRDDWDINIAMPHCLIGWADAWDLLQATPWFPPDEADAAAERLAEVTRQFHRDFVLDEGTRNLMLGPAQNNHPIRTAVAIGYVGLALWDHPLAPSWRSWAFSELDYLWSERGHYLLGDGAISEGPFYSGYAWTPSLALFSAVDHSGRELELLRSCLNRNDADPWTDHGCVEGERFVFDNPLRSARFQAWADWSIGLRLPWGARPPREDSRFSAPNGIAALTGLGGAGHHRWDWEHNRDWPERTTHALDTKILHLVRFDDSVVAAEPPFRSRVAPVGGEAVFRSSWSDDAVWGMLMGEHGDARKTLHDHVDGTSFQLAAYGEYLLLDPGYFKPVDYNNARTANSDAHNLVLIDGVAAPDKGLLTNFGDADAFLEHGRVDAELEYAEAWQDYGGSHVERSALFVGGRYFVLADRLTSDEPAREHRWRMSGWAGLDSGGAFVLRADGGRWERALAGVDVFVASDGALSVEQPPFEEDQAPYAHEIEGGRATTHHEVLDGVVQGVAPSFLSVLAPYRVGATDGEAPLAVTPIDGLGWRIEGAGFVDVALLNPGGGLIEVAGVRTDAEFALARLVGEPWAAVARGSFLSVEGEVRIEGADPAGVGFTP